MGTVMLLVKASDDRDPHELVELNFESSKQSTTSYSFFKNMSKKPWIEVAASDLDNWLIKENCDKDLEGVPAVLSFTILLFCYSDCIL